MSELRTLFELYLTEFLADVLRKWSQNAHILQHVSACQPRTWSNEGQMECVAVMSFMWILTFLRKQFTLNLRNVNRADKRTFAVWRISDVYSSVPSDFDGTFKICCWILNLKMESRSMLVDKFKSINKVNLKDVVLAQTPSSKNVNGTGSNLA